MIQEMLVILLLATAFPAGLLIAYCTKDELISGRTYFKLIFAISLFLSIVLFLIEIFSSSSLSHSLTFAYLSILSVVSYAKSNNKKFLSYR